MRLARLAAKAAAVFLAAGLVVAFFPVVVALALGTNWRQTADGLGSLPGVHRDAPVSTALAGFGYGVVCWLFVVAAGAGAIGVTPATLSDEVDSTTTSRPASVVAVVDGDTLDVRFPDGSTDTVRLLGIDAPETHAQTTPGEFEGVADNARGRQCLAQAGARATDALSAAVQNETVELRFDADSPRRGSYDRLLAYVVENETNHNYRLVEAGHARVYDSSFTQADRFYAAESDARAAAAGLWACQGASA